MYPPGERIIYSVAFAGAHSWLALAFPRHPGTPKLNASNYRRSGAYRAYRLHANFYGLLAAIRLHLQIKSRATGSGKRNRTHANQAKHLTNTRESLVRFLWLGNGHPKENAQLHLGRFVEAIRHNNHGIKKAECVCVCAAYEQRYIESYSYQ